jgi:1-acyl-sn-glycerol-3-phosphate acyltransferase
MEQRTERAGLGNGAGDVDAVLRRWGRRAITVSLYIVSCLVIVGSLPALIVIAAVTDIVRASRWAGVRFIAMLAFYFCCEVAGIAMSFLLWLTKVLTGTRRERFLGWNFALQQWWAGSLFRAGRLLFSINVEVEGADGLGDGPFIVFIRHVSVGDTLLPSTILSRRYGLRLRYVLKSQLLWDPCLDIVGNRLPNCFVRRGAGDEMATSAVRRLMDGLCKKDGVLIYPEGTRFTLEKRERILDRLRGGDAELVGLARGLKYVLPPRLGGTLALLGRNESADALFCGHVGLEGVTDFRDFLGGSMVGATLRVRFWRVAYDEIPRERAAQAKWFYEHWSRLDDWVGQQK